MYNFDPYNVLLAIATNIPVLLMTAFVLIINHHPPAEKQTLMNLMNSDMFQISLMIWIFQAMIKKRSGFYEGPVLFPVSL